MKQVCLSLLLCLPFLYTQHASAQVKKYAIKKVVIDAGHGGHDSGCRGKFSSEKDVALAVSLKLGKLIEESMPDVKVFYTRKTDVFVTLNDRAEIANNLKADIFICVHCNAGSKVASGTETYVMGLHKSEENLHVAERENASILMEEDRTKYDGFNPNSPEAYIAFSLYQNAFLDQSLNIASKVEKNLTSKGREDRGVKQAGFWVLYRTTMPSLLIETGFLTNPSEEKFLNSESGQTEISQGIFKAFREYKTEMDEKSGLKGKEVEKEKDKVKGKDIDPKTENIDTAKKLEVIVDTIPLDPAKTYFAVQIASGTKKNPVDLRRGIYKELNDSINIEELPNGALKYTFGNTPNYTDAIKIQNDLKEKGFKSAFIVGYNDGKRIPVKQAQDLIKNIKVN